METSRYRLNPKLDRARLAEEYRCTGRLHIPEFLAREDAERLYRFLKASDGWRLIVNQGDRLFELDRDAQAALSPERRRKLDRAVHAAARHGFQYLYESIRVPDEDAARAATATTSIPSRAFSRRPRSSPSSGRSASRPISPMRRRPPTASATSSRCTTTTSRESAARPPTSST